MGRRTRWRRRDPAVAAVACRASQVPPRPHRQRPHPDPGHGGPAHAAGGSTSRRGHRHCPRAGCSKPAARGGPRGRGAIAARLDGRHRTGCCPARARGSRRADRLVRRRPRDHRRCRVRCCGSGGGSGGRRRTAGDDRHRADACRHRLRLRPRRRCPRRSRHCAVGRRVRREAGPVPCGGLPGVGGVPLERRHLRGPGLSAARPARREPPGAGSRAARDRGRPGVADGALARSDQDRDRLCGGRAGGCS